MKILVGFILLILGYMLAFYAGFCLLGGPDGAILSRDSFIFGIPSFAISVLLVFISNKLLFFKRYAFIPHAIIILSWLMVAVGFRAGFYVWLFGTIISSIAVILYQIILLVMQKNRQI